VLGRGRHDGEDPVQHLIRHAGVEEVAMGGDEDVAPAGPEERLEQPLLVEPDLARPDRAGLGLAREARAGRMMPQAGAGQLHRIAVRAARGVDGAPGHDLPRGVGPLDG